MIFGAGTVIGKPQTMPPGGWAAIEPEPELDRGGRRPVEYWVMDPDGEKAGEWMSCKQIAADPRNTLGLTDRGILTRISRMKSRGWALVSRLGRMVLVEEGERRVLSWRDIQALRIKE